ncbi:hypothetical protein KAK05_01615, partial [Candidatus Parcubacteria bacterium]|nr:hypothetical protein [Candidatus Parcubacteria bacterium]
KTSKITIMLKDNNRETNWPVCSNENLVLGNMDSEIVIVTLWTPTKKITDELDPDSFCVAGQLYSKEGINFIIRNILAKPSIRYLIVCGTELSGSGKVLVDFFEKGVDNDQMVIGNDFAKIHKEIPKKSLDLIRKNVELENLIGVQDINEIKKKISDYKSIGKLFSEPQVFPDAKKEETKIFPTDQSVFKVRGKYIGNVWLQILKKILKFGIENPTWYGGNVKELFNIAAVITEEDPLDPKMFPFMQISKEDIEKYSANIMSGEKGDEVYTYGERLWNYKGINQVEDVIIPYLKKYPTDRAAIAMMFDLGNDHKAERAPCMTQVQATALGDELNLTAYFRSHAIFSGWVLNAFGLRTVQKHIADKLSKKIGTLTIFSNCSHIYDNEWQTAEGIVRKYGNKITFEATDPRGYFMISVENKDIVVKHYTPKGEYIQEFRQNGMEEKASVLMYRKLLLADAVSEISHAFDLGAELQKAEIAVKQGIRYKQDEKLKFLDEKK